MNAILAAVASMSLLSASGGAVSVETGVIAGSSQMEPMEIDEAAYASAKWPAHNTGSLNAKDVQGEKLSVPLGGETWLTEEKDLTGKVVVLDFWAVWCPPCRAAEPKFHALQKEFGGKLQIVGVSGQGEEQSTVEAYIGKKKDLNYSHVYDSEQQVYRSLQVRAIPHVVVLSTDGVVRWQGNPHEKSFKDAVAQVIANDPMIKAKNSG